MTKKIRIRDAAFDVLWETEADDFDAALSQLRYITVDGDGERRGGNVSIHVTWVDATFRR